MDVGPLPPLLATTILAYNGLGPEQSSTTVQFHVQFEPIPSPNIRPLLFLTSRGKVVRNYCLSEAVLDFSRSARLQAIVDCVRQCKPRWPRCLRGRQATAKIPIWYPVRSRLIFCLLHLEAFSDFLFLSTQHHQSAANRPSSSAKACHYEQSSSFIRCGQAGRA